MRLFGWTIAREKAEQKASAPVDSRGGWWSLIREPFAGAWQRNLEIKTDFVLTYSAVFACVTLIANDISKLRLRLVRQDADGIWQETESAAFSPVLRRPNRYQNRIQFFANWVTSKLVHGNAYILKERDQRGIVTALYILDPNRVRPLVADDGSIYYELSRDNLTGLQDDRLVVPAKEIIHDVMVPLYHPLCGVSPIAACGLPATQGLAIQNNSTRFFQNGGRPGGIITAPGYINAETALRLKTHWESSYSGENMGRTAVLGDGLQYQPIVMSNIDAQLVEQLRMTAETVCSTFHVPAHMVGVGSAPTYNNIEALNQEYYSQCLQAHIESIELLLDEGLELPKPYGTEFDLDGLLRMDTATKVKAAADALQAGGMSPNEARKRYFDLGPTEGGESPYLQVQNYSLAALAKRDQNSTPLTPGLDQPAAEPAPPAVAEEAEARRVGALRAATREFHRLASEERMNAKLVH